MGFGLGFGWDDLVRGVLRRAELGRAQADHERLVIGGRVRVRVRVRVGAR